MSHPLGWRRRVLPPGPKGLLRWPFIAISVPRDGKENIGDSGRGWKGAEITFSRLREKVARAKRSAG
jgi:hypothetical protein